MLFCVGHLILKVLNFVNLLTQFNPATYSVPKVGRSGPRVSLINAFSLLLMLECLRRQCETSDSYKRLNNHILHFSHLILVTVRDTYNMSMGEERCKAFICMYCIAQKFPSFISARAPKINFIFQPII
jgi:hypothetical protein